MLGLNSHLVIILLTVMGVEVAESSPARQSNSEYCNSKYKCGNELHYACDHKEITGTTDAEIFPTGFPYLPGGLKLPCSFEAKMTDEDRRDVLKLVNDFRNRLAAGLEEYGHGDNFPKGANIRQVSWDNEMEMFSRIFGTNAANATDPVPGWPTWMKNVCSKTKNLKKTETALNHNQGEVSISASIEAWTETKPPPDLIEKFDPHSAGPFFQGGLTWTLLAWAKVTNIGCTLYKTKCDTSAIPTLLTLPQGYTLPTLSFSTMVFTLPPAAIETAITNPGKAVDKSLPSGFVCFIGPDANTVGEPVYAIGSTCSDCPPNTKCKSWSLWPNLCATPEDIVDPDKPNAAVGHPRILLMPALVVSVVWNHELL